MSDYQQEWQQHSRRRNQLLLVAIGYMPVCFTVAFVSVKLFHTTTPGLVFGFFLDWSVLGHRKSRAHAAVFSLRKMVFGNLVVQPEFFRETMRSLRFTQI
jgi:hypothetical protein